MLEQVWTKMHLVHLRGGWQHIKKKKKQQNKPDIPKANLRDVLNITLYTLNKYNFNLQPYHNEAGEENKETEAQGGEVDFSKVTEKSVAVLVAQPCPTLRPHGL